MKIVRVQFHVVKKIVHAQLQSLQVVVNHHPDFQELFRGLQSHNFYDARS